MTILPIFIIFVILIGGFITYAKISTKKAKALEKDTWLMRFWAKDAVKVVAASLISICIGLLFGCLILLIFSGYSGGGITITFKSCWKAIQLVFLGGFNTGTNANDQLIYGWNGVNIGNMLFRATPLIMTGLAVAIAFKTGLFNIGAPGQYLMGSMVALVIALGIPSDVVPPFVIWIIAFIGAILAGALWGAIPGIFKAFLNVNEVITCIMCNWIAANLVTAAFDKTTGIFKQFLDPDGTKNLAYVFKTTHNNVATFKMGLDKIFPGSQINAGILVAIIIAIIMYIVINKTVFGYELKACGANRHAAKYAGIKARRNIILSMAISGAMAGIGGMLYYLSGNTEFQWETYQTLPAIGFNGIPVALLAINNPIGVIFSSIFMAYLDVSGMQIKYMTSYNEHIASIIGAVIVYFSAFSLVIRQYLSKPNKGEKIKKLFEKIGSLFKKKKKEELELAEPIAPTETKNNSEEEESK